MPIYSLYHTSSSASCKQRKADGSWLGVELGQPCLTSPCLPQYKILKQGHQLIKVAYMLIGIDMVCDEDAKFQWLSARKLGRRPLEDILKMIKCWKMRHSTVSIMDLTAIIKMGFPQMGRQGCRWVTTQKRKFSFGCGKYSQPLSSHVRSGPLGFAYARISGSHSLIFLSVTHGWRAASYPCLSKKSAWMKSAYIST